MSALSLHAALTAEHPTEHARWLGVSDEPALRELLRARYHETYSYRTFYSPGVLAELWKRGRLASLGEYDDQGKLVAHTGFFLECDSSSVESGLSLTHPTLRSAMSREEHLRMWRYVLGILKTRVTFLHQNTTTLHPLAQRYAARCMHARATGIIFDYTAGETLIGVAGSSLPMLALCMTTLFEPLPRKPCFLPQGAFGQWLLELLGSLDLHASAELVPLAPQRPAPRFELLSFNPALGLERRRICMNEAEPPASELRSCRARVDLIHLPTHQSPLVAAFAPMLLEAGYRPVGLALNHPSAHEIVFQHMKDPAYARDALLGARIADAQTRALLMRWSELCAQTS